MESTIIVQFVNAVRNVFSTMAKTNVTCGKPHFKAAEMRSHEVSGIIGFAGSITGAIILSLPREVAVELVARFSTLRLEPGHPDFADALGELVNMVAGSAKSKIPQTDVTISCPTVVLGNNIQVLQGKSQPIIVIPCQCDAGTF